MFLYSHWLKLPIQTRTLIANQFLIVKKSSTEVFNNEIVKDGYIVGDIEQALNVDALQKYTGSDETDMAVLWDMLVAKIEGRELPAVGLVSEPTTFNAQTIEPILVVPEEVLEVAKSNPSVMSGKKRGPKKK